MQNNLINLEAIRLLEEVEIRAVKRRLFHIRDDPFDLFNKEFIKLYRVNKRIAENVINIVDQYFDEPTRSSALDIVTQVKKIIKLYISTRCVTTHNKLFLILKVTTAIRFMASGSYQADIGHNIYSAISQPAVSRCINNITKVLNEPEVFNRWIKCPSNLQEVKSVRDGIVYRFWQKYQFPGVIGCIDCTHMAIIAPPTCHPQFPEHIYVNRKGYHSINVQLVSYKHILPLCRIIIR
ncbi:uncharacterized protein [Linepithema humile]|uniref:uncharacterized protein n=1 Tax=Linepithema humile TaxID=83485 RepID=UPI00351E53F7